MICPSVSAPGEERHGRAEWKKVLALGTSNQVCKPIGGDIWDRANQPIEASLDDEKTNNEQCRVTRYKPAVRGALRIEELEAEYEAAVEYPNKAIHVIARVRREIIELECAEASATTTSAATDTFEQKAARQLMRSSF